MTAPSVIPVPALIVLIGPSGAGKSTWAGRAVAANQVVSSDALRAAVGSGAHDLDASDDAFAVLDVIVAARARRGLTTVVDTLGLDAAHRRGWRDIARAAGLPAVAVLFTAAPAVCRRRNASRDRPVPAAALDAQLARMPGVVETVDDEGWDLVVTAGDTAVVEPVHLAGTAAAAARQLGDGPVADRRELEIVLQISRFPWGTDPANWLASIADTAEQVGAHGLALMDHLIQIPQVGRAWDPIPEPWVTLGLLAARSTTLRLGPLVTPVTFRSAGAVAKAAATLDVLTGGRAFCGIGAGWWGREHAGFGIDFPPAATRLDGLAAAVETLRALWSTGTKPFAGDHVTLPETTCYPRPVSRIPIIVGGSGERRTLQIAARYADACNLPSDLDVLDRKIAALQGHCAEVGRDPVEVAITVLDVPIIGSDPDDVVARIERRRGSATAATFARRHHAGPIRDQIGRYRQLVGRGVRTVFIALPDLDGPDDIERLAPLIEAFRAS